MEFIPWVKNKVAALTCVMLVLYGCKTAQNIAANKPGYLYSAHFKKPVIDKELYAATTEVIAVDTAYAQGDSLHVITPKIPGCNADDFRLMWNGVYDKDKPTQTTVKLFQAFNPACTEKNKFHLIFNIKPLQLKQDSVPNKSVLIRFGNYKGLIHYNY